MEPFLGQIQPFGFNFAPRGWEFCNGQLIAISSNTALYSLLGTFYGGDGRTTFGLPDLRGRTPISTGHAPGTVENINMGTRIGNQVVTLSVANLPTHKHEIAQNNLRAQVMTSTAGNNTNESGSGENGLASGGSTPNIYTTSPSFNEYLNPNSIELTGKVSTSDSGSGQSFPIQQPSLALNYCIATIGIFPSRN